MLPRVLYNEQCTHNITAFYVNNVHLHTRKKYAL